MKVTKSYEVPQEKVFDALLSSFAEDYKRNSQKEIRPYQIKPGVTYKKQFGQKTQYTAEVTMVNMEYPSLYEVQLTTNRGVNTICYVLNTSEDQKTEITYEERTENQSLMEKLNYRILLPFFKKKFQKQMLSQLDGVAQFASQ